MIGNYAEGFGGEKPQQRWEKTIGSQIRPAREESKEQEETQEQEYNNNNNNNNNNSNNSNDEEGEGEYFQAARKILGRRGATPSPTPSPAQGAPGGRLAHSSPAGRPGGMGGSMVVRRERPPSQRPGVAVGGYSVDEEVEKLVSICERLCGGKTGEFTFKDIFYDEESEGQFESLMGTLKAAKKRGIISYEAPVLFQGANDDDRIVFHGGK